MNIRIYLICSNKIIQIIKYIIRRVLTKLSDVWSPVATRGKTFDKSGECEAGTTTTTDFNVSEKHVWATATVAVECGANTDYRRPVNARPDAEENVSSRWRCQRQRLGCPRHVGRRRGRHDGNDNNGDDNLRRWRPNIGTERQQGHRYRVTPLRVASRFESWVQSARDRRRGLSPLKPPRAPGVARARAYCTPRIRGRLGRRHRKMTHPICHPPLPFEIFATLSQPTNTVPCRRSSRTVAWPP